MSNPSSPSLSMYERCPNSLIISVVFHWPHSSTSTSVLHWGAQDWMPLQVWAHHGWIETEKFAFVKSSVNIFKQAHYSSIFSTPWSNVALVPGITKTVHLSSYMHGCLQDRSHENASRSEPMKQQSSRSGGCRWRKSRCSKLQSRVK